MNASDQIDVIVMKYIFQKSQDSTTFDQLSLCRGVNQEMILDEMPQIRYDLVELYWQKMYGSTKP